MNTTARRAVWLQIYVALLQKPDPDKFAVYGKNPRDLAADTDQAVAEFEKRFPFSDADER